MSWCRWEWDDAGVTGVGYLISKLRSITITQRGNIFNMAKIHAGENLKSNLLQLLLSSHLLVFQLHFVDSTSVQFVIRIILLRKQTTEFMWHHQHSDKRSELLAFSLSLCVSFPLRQWVRHCIAVTGNHLKQRSWKWLSSFERLVPD